MKLSYGMKLMASFIAFGLILMLTALFMVYKLSEINARSTNIDAAKEVFDARALLFEQFVKDYSQRLIALEESQRFQRYLENPQEHQADTKDLFYDIAYASGKIMQLRFIDRNGMEKIRVERDHCEEPVKTIGEAMLQDKSSRYYFHDVIGLKEGIIWYSKLDLNVEHGKIEEPIKPVMRIAKPVHVNGLNHGMLIVNVFMHDFLEQLIEASMYNIYLTDKNGHFLMHPQEVFRWSRYLKTGYMLEQHLTNEAPCILNNRECIEERLYSKILPLQNGENLRLVVEPKLYELEQSIQWQIVTLLFIFLGIMTVFLPIAGYFAKEPVRLNKEIACLNRHIKESMREKVAELKSLNTALENEVQARTEELEKANAKLYKNATTDHLTKIPNRRYFLEMGERYLELAHRKQYPLCLMIIDLDHFKEVNDTYGHNAGDKVLTQCVELIGLRLRKSDIFGRIGGEEFGVLLHDSSLEESMQIAETIRESVAVAKFDIGQQKIDLTISIGLGILHENEQTLSPLMSRADEALYRAKNNGRNRVEKLD
jgi:diguanylate cyclase (GGDEF)-like protein